MNKEYKFEAKVWVYPGNAGWHFVSVPEKITKEIDFYFDHLKKGFGSLPVLVKVGKTEWETSIFPDKKTSTYLLPIKKKVREVENFGENETIKVEILVGRK